MGAFEGGAGSLGVVLVVNGDQGVRRDDRVEVAAQRRGPGEGVGAVGREACVGRCERGVVRVMTVFGCIAHVYGNAGLRTPIPSVTAPGRRRHQAVPA
ncbi:hypothetical protein ABT144_05350 [Streptomyces sp. NPDC002039]|uniref:hypothetical protein n=1 Tax=unclassified Streptomyces TaxID=2593676 RepID=UPI00331B2E67